MTGPIAIFLSSTIIAVTSLIIYDDFKSFQKIDEIKKERSLDELQKQAINGLIGKPKQAKEYCKVDWKTGEAWVRIGPDISYIRCSIDHANRLKKEIVRYVQDSIKRRLP